MDNIQKLADIRLLAMDIDGTLTAGGLVFNSGLQLKEFNVYDGLGIRLALMNGLQIAWITGNTSDTVTDRARSLGVAEVCQGVQDKARAIYLLADKYQITTDQIAYIGDDLNDYPAYQVAGFKFAVANAVEEIKQISDCITIKAGGKGAVREAIEAIFKAKGIWEDVVAGYIESLKTGEASEDLGNIA